MAYDYSAAVAMADEMIHEYGAVAVLRRTAGDRLCIACVLDYTPEERQGKLINAVDRFALLSAKDPSGALLEPPPNKDLDHLVTFIPETYGEEDEVLKIVQPPGKLAPSGVVVYWELQVRGAYSVA